MTLYDHYINHGDADMNYTVEATGNTFASFNQAIREANIFKCNVLDENGNSKWSPAPPVSAKRMRRYNEQLAAYQAQRRTA